MHARQDRKRHLLIDGPNTAVTAGNNTLRSMANFIG